MLNLCLLITTIVVPNLFYHSTKSQLLGINSMSKHQDLQIFVLKLHKSDCQPLEVLGRGSGTHLQEDANSNKIT